jgi:hypothetical protein
MIRILIRFILIFIMKNLIKSNKLKNKENYRILLKYLIYLDSTYYINLIEYNTSNTLYM